MLGAAVGLLVSALLLPPVTAPAAETGSPPDAAGREAGRVSAAVAADSPSAPAARAQLDSALTLARRHALWRDTVSWSVLEPEVRALAAGARTPGDVYPAIRRLLAQLGDRHSSVMTPRAHATYVAGRFANPAPVVRVVGDTASDTADDRVSNGVGVVTLPPYLGNVPDSVGAYVERLHRALVAAAPHARRGWVVDLRRDRGGNMTPMLGGLRPFLGDGTLGTMVPPGPDPGTPWNARRVPVAPPHALAPLEIAYVAVLTGRGTARAGEAVVVSFRGRPRTRTFGQATAGLTSGTRGFPLPDGGALVLATVAFADRTGRRYDGGIAPDELVNPTTRGPAGRDDDAPLTRARAWLAGASGCGAAP